jgi:2-hydroxy-3-keto-5-methylthiopentenyl-1-phosphate phosphatase
MANVLCLGFDDAIVLDNTARQIFERFAAPGWRDAEAAYQAGRMSEEEFNAAALDLVTAPRGELTAYVRAVARVRPGFMELLDWVHWNDWLAMVVSNGFDFSVDAVLDGLGIDRITRHAGRTRREYRWRVAYYSPRGVEVRAGFKLSYVAALKGAGDFVAYVGGGASDVEATTLADVVFARSTLLERLDVTRKRVFAFDTFDDVRSVLESESVGWLTAHPAPESSGQRRFFQ